MLAAALLTRLPLPSLPPAQPEEMAATTDWYAPIGLIIGAVLALLATILPDHPWVNALMITLVWIAISGGMHLDGVADLADGLGAAHRDSTRLLAVMKDPHIGSFGVVALIAVVLTKVIAVATLLQQGGGSAAWWLVLAPAWARLGAAWWACSLPPLGSGMGSAIAGSHSLTPLPLSALLLALLTVAGLPATSLLIALLALLLWQQFLRHRLGGFNGDCLGAGIEYCECALLLSAVFIV